MTDDRILGFSKGGGIPAPKAASGKPLAVETYIPVENGAGEKALGSGKPPGGPALSPAEIKEMKRRLLENAGDPLLESPSGPPAATLSSGAFPKPLDPVDDLPPATVITFVGKAADGKWVVRGTTSDNDVVKRVLVNGQDARAMAPNFAEWEITLEGMRPEEGKLMAYAEDVAGNIEKTPHVVSVAAPR